MSNVRSSFYSEDLFSSNLQPDKYSRYNYGKRLLIDITIPEPAALLMTQSTSNGPSLEEPQTFTESAADLHEGNFSAIAARYKASGVKAPGEILMSFLEVIQGRDTSSSGNAKAWSGTCEAIWWASQCKLRH